jgi:uncharacterized protein YqeY
MLIDEVKQRMFQAIKAGSTVEKEVLRTAIGEVTRTGDEATDERVLGVLRKLVKSNRETLAAATDATQRAALEREITVLETFLPKSLDAEELRLLLEPVAAQIREAAGAGAAMGVAMKFLKTTGTTANAGDVRAALNELRKP